ncbi:MAG: DUF333 domain-containing protein [Candidatus Diapherotrites archaeon]|nr:DUF333 domain-containing protein [Candidatus Diapherotrites archaeon]
MNNGGGSNNGTGLSDGNNALVGGDRDSHGCIGSAGYTWCEAKQKCLRIWEETCDDRLVACTMDYNPVCGINEITYGNACTAKAAGIAVEHNGECTFGNTQSSGIANPASMNCQNHGGTLNIVTDSNGGQVGMCTLSSGKICEEWAYMRGECS